MTARISSLLAAAMLLAAHSGAPGAEAYTARLENGTVISGSELRGWSETNAQPELRGRGGNHPLLNAGNHARWLRNNERPPPKPPATYVEFILGDRLPGKVTAYRAGDENPLDRQGPHLVVEHRGDYDWPNQERESLRVSTLWLRRIVWRPVAGDRYEPGTLFTREGRRLAYRSLRFNATGVRLLLDEGTQNVPFADMAELHLPRSEPWDAYLEQVARLSPNGAARLIRIETADGLIATASMERFAVRRHESAQPQPWLHMVQPAWSLDPLWARFGAIQSWRFAQPHQVPLSDLDPVRQSDPLSGGGHWRWHKDRNVQGDLLRAGGEEFGWGIGGHAPQALAYSLPAAAKSFRTRIGLDELAGRGGCARALVHLGDERTVPIFRSDLLIGSKSVLSPPPVAIPASADRSEPRTLTLVADAAHRDRPAGADPLNIRDFVDWLEPELELDRGELARELRRRAPPAIAAWEGWTLASSKKGDDLTEAIELVNQLDETSPRDESFRHLVRPRVAGLSLKRTVKLRPDDEWLCLAVSRLTDAAPVRIDIRLNGKSVGQFEVPERKKTASREQPEPIAVSLRTHRGQQLVIEIVPQADGGSKLDWRGVAISKDRPGLLCLFDEQPDFAKRLDAGDGKAEVVSTDHYLGELSLKVTPPERGAARLISPPVAVRQYPRAGEFRYLRFAWKKKAGERIALQIAHDGRFGPEDAKDATPGKSFRYDAGIGPPTLGSAVRRKDRLPSDWDVVTCDLYADFGDFNLTGLSLVAPDGEYALFDHIYLARTLDDLQRIEVRPAGK
jgi:hypothetical protein